MRRLFLLLGLLNCCSLLFATNVFTYGNINDVDKTCYVYPKGSYSGKIIIPDSVEIENREGVYSVIGVGSFTRYDAGITEVVLPSTIKKLSYEAFRDCMQLTKVVLSEGVSIIEDRAFYNTGIEEITIPNSVVSIGEMAFYKCEKLKTVYIGNGVTALDKAIFIACKSIEQMYIGNGLTTITASCFKSGVGWYAPKLLVIMSDKLDSNSSFIGAEKIFVPNPECCSEIFKSNSNLFYSVAELKTTTPLTYTGHSPKIFVNTLLDSLLMTVCENELPVVCGTHSDTLNVDVSHGSWHSSVRLPYQYTIDKAPLKILANNLTKYYGDDNFDFSFTAFGLVNEETSDVLTKQPIVSSTATVLSDAGAYPIIAMGAEAENYDISYEQGTLTILKAPQTISWEPNFTDANIGELIELSATSTSGLDVKFKSLDMTTAIVTINNGKSYVYPIKEGTVVIAAYQDGDKNHEAADEVYNVLTIGSTTGISNIQGKEKQVVYDLNGRVMNSRTKGLKIIKGSTGKCKKIF